MRILGTSVAVATLMLALTAAPAKADKPVSVTLPQCTNTDISPTALQCTGFFAGNLMGGNPDQKAAQATQLGNLGLTGPIVQREIISPLNGSMVIDFETALFGITYIGLHFGGANGDNGPGASASAFYKFDAGNGMNNFNFAGLDEIFITQYGGSSNAVLFSTGVSRFTTAVPEPASWLMMILTVGIAGAALRRKRDGAAAADHRDGHIPAGFAA